MKPHVVLPMAAALLFGGVALAADFEVRLGLVNAHLKEVYFGCHAKGTEGYDRDLDDFSPPPGIDTGYVGFIPPAKLPPLYKDIRGPQGPHEWKLSLRVARDRPVQVSWDPTSLPAGWTFTLAYGELTLVMSDTASLSVPETGTLIIRAAAQPAALPAQGEKKAP